MLTREQIAALSQEQKANHYEQQLLKDVKNNHTILVKETLEDVINTNASSFSINVFNSDQETALYIACTNGNLDIVKLLIHFNGINVNLGKRTNGWGIYLFKCCVELTSPLYVAALSGHLQIVQALVVEGRANYNINIPTSALHAAITNNKTDVAEYLLSLPSINIESTELAINNSKNYEPLLYTAVAKGNLRLVNALLATGRIDVNEFAKYSTKHDSYNHIESSHFSQNNALICAIGNMPIFQKLLEQANIVFNNSYEIQKVGLDYKETIISPLGHAIINRKIEFANKLIDDPRYDKKFGKNEVIDISGDPGSRNDYEYSTLDLAINAGLNEIADKLRNAGVTEITKVNAAAPNCALI